ncbi:hypothetical protein Tco_0991111 [Tanacetum coccineum]|uniref:Uncharacterized protein n=1 Tax=Tanacetum coccineum TaxID=301880 RepID=A0ABQ5EYQ7_9ASTR
MAKNQHPIYIGTNNNNISYADADANRSFNDLLSHLSGVLKSSVMMIEAIPTSVTKAERSLSNLSSEDVATKNECKDGPFSNALISEMEADMHGIHIIKNVELEERKELGAGTYGTVYHEDGESRSEERCNKGQRMVVQSSVGKIIVQRPCCERAETDSEPDSQAVQQLPQPSLHRRRGIEPLFSSAIRDHALNQIEDSCLDANSNVLANSAKDLGDWLIHRYTLAK